MPQREVKEGDEGKTEIDREQESAEERAALLSKSPAKINPLRGENKTSCEIKLWHPLSKNDATFIRYSQVSRRDGKVVLAVALAPPPPPCRHMYTTLPQPGQLSETPESDCTPV